MKIKCHLADTWKYINKMKNKSSQEIIPGILKSKKYSGLNKQKSGDPGIVNAKKYHALL